MAGAAQPRPASPPPRLKVRVRKDTVRQIKLKLSQLNAERARKRWAFHARRFNRWERMPEPLSRRPKRPRQPTWPPALIEVVEALRADNPMWGKRKIARSSNATAWPRPSPPSGASSAGSSPAATPSA